MGRWAILFIGLIVLANSVESQSQGRPKALMGTQLKLVDGAGNAWLIADRQDGRPTLRMIGTAGKPRLELFYDVEGAAIFRIYDARGNARVHIGAGAKGEAVVSLLNDDEVARIRLFCDAEGKESRIRISQNDGKLRYLARAFENRDVEVLLHDSDESTRIRLAAPSVGEGSVQRMSADKPKGQSAFAK